MTGIELIAKERDEQINKHGFEVESDEYYSNNELIKAALFCIEQSTFEWPIFWSTKFRNKILSKDRIGQLKTAGAFIAAEIDRLKYIIDKETIKENLI